MKSRNANNVIVEIDILNFCTSFSSGCRDFSYVSLLIKQCRSIASDIENFVIHHVKRSANHVAHVLARATGSPYVLGVWDSCP
ncbi:reverse transcriptase-like protein, partial [Escherichia coli]|uniref:reverse transcriptase-like protein n=1 Tax=Escherichia coli TaxID=562 RepID=UPI003D8147BF